MKRWIKRLLMAQLAKRGYRLAKIGKAAGQGRSEDDMRSALERLMQIKEDFSVVIDVGAARGAWTRKAIQFWPSAEYFLIEPLVEHVEYMQANMPESIHTNICVGVAGPEEGMASINVTEDILGSGIYGRSENAREVRMFSLDSIYQSSVRKGPVLLKLDTHGYELPIFEGAHSVLADATAVIVEVYGFYVSPTARLFHEVTDYLMNRGFRLFDIVDVMRRDKDGAFWQADAVYIRSDVALFEDNSYK